jgi:ATP-dependent Lon protease
MTQKWEHLPLIFIPEEEMVFPSHEMLQIILSKNSEYWSYTLQTFLQQDTPDDYFVIMLNAAQSEHDILDTVIGNVGILCQKHSVKFDHKITRVSFIALHRVTVKYVKKHRYHKYPVGTEINQGDAVQAYDINTLDTIMDIPADKVSRFLAVAKGQFFGLNKNLALDTPDNRETYHNLELFIDYACNHHDYMPDLLYHIWKESSLQMRLTHFLTWCKYRHENTQIDNAINDTVTRQIELNNKEYYLKEKLKAIRQELNMDQSVPDELEISIHKTALSQEAKDKSLKEVERLRNLNVSGPDFDIGRNYVEKILSLPWGKTTSELQDYNIGNQLDKTHFGLNKIKKRIVEYMALMQRRSTHNDVQTKVKDKITTPILCFVGPPGVGKTTIAMAIADILKRKFAHISLGGMSDESEVRGHRRTFIGANVGTFVDKLITLGVDNPVILLDEMDKISRDNYRGNVAATLLEILDPAQNSRFRDLFLDISYDFSKVLFISTANTTSTIPQALLDRLEVIQISGYTEQEKINIAQKHIIPQLKKEYILDNVVIPVAPIKHILSHYVFESGVRNLRRALDAIFRGLIVKLFHMDASTVFHIGKDDLQEFLGLQKINIDEMKVNKKPSIGRVTGLGYQASGIGCITPIEALILDGSGKIQITGNLGKVMHESVVLAHMVVRSLLPMYNIPQNILSGLDLCVHFTQAGISKDGPSAGAGICLAILSAVTKKHIVPNFAITGELTLHGDILPVGGIVEKITAASMCNIPTAYVPYANRNECQELPEALKKKVKINLYKTMLDIIPQLIY